MTVWDRIGIDHPFRVKGGYVWWNYAINTRSMRMVRLDRLVTLPDMKLKVVHRYVKPDTLVAEVAVGDPLEETQ